MVVSLAACLAAAMLPVAHAVKPPKPELVLPLEPLGYMGYNARVADEDAALLSASFLDATHVLLTFHARTLVSRNAEDRKGDQTRNVAAVLLELPTGRVLARTEWHVFDYARYLWPLADGRFLLRIRNSVRVIDPLRGLTHGDAFEQTVLLRSSETMMALAVSPVGSVLTLQTALPRRKLTADGTAVAAAAPNTADGPVMVEFMRLQTTPAGLLQAVVEGRARSPNILRLPVDDAGYLLIRDSDHGDWQVDFDNYDGASKPVGNVESSCAPLLEFASRSQYVALACRGSDDHQAMSAFDFSGHELWQERFRQDSHDFNFRFAPAAGRFAVSRSMDAAVDPNDTTHHAGLVQELRVYATESGDLLLQTQFPQETRRVSNFDLSPDGERLLAIREGRLLVYPLGKLSRTEQADLADARALEPATGSGAILLTKLQKEPASDTAAAVASASGTTTLIGTGEAEATGSGNAVAGATARAAGSLTDAPAMGTEPTAGEGGVGDATTARKRPTLLNPGEKPEFADKSTAPAEK